MTNDDMTRALTRIRRCCEAEAVEAISTELIGAFPLDGLATRRAVTVNTSVFEDWWRGIECGEGCGTGSLGRLLRDAVRAVAASGSREVESALVYTVNELIENALKADPEGGIEVSLGTDEEGVSCFVSHPVPAESIPELRRTLSRVVAGDPGGLIRQQVEENLGGSGSGLGLLTIIHHHDARLGWKVEHRPPELARLTTSACLPIIRR